jgi:hypothetical protein
MRRIVGLVLIIVLTVLATLAESARNSLWQSYRDYNSPYLEDLPAGSSRSPVSGQVVVVLVRGLQEDASRKMPALNELRLRGADLIVQLSSPTFRLPSLVTLATGATAETTGVTTNYAPRPTEPDSLFRELQFANVNVVMVGSQSLSDEFGDQVQRFEPVDDADVVLRDDEAMRLGLAALQDPNNPARLLWIELTAPEGAAGAEAADYAAALSVTDDRLKTLLAALDLNTATLIVLSDRGLTAQGADGGEEPEVARVPMVLAGAGVATGVQAIIAATDVAPTLAALTGAPVPVQAQGHVASAVLAFPATAEIAPPTPISDTTPVSQTLAPLPSNLWASAVQLTTFYESWSEAVHQPRFAAELLRLHQDDIQTGDAQAYQKFVTTLESRAASAAGARLSAERTQRLPLTVGAAILILVMIGIALSAGLWRPLLGLGLYLLLWYALFFVVRGQRYSLSMFANAEPALFVESLARTSAILLAVVSIVIAFTTSGHEEGLDAIATVLTTVGLIVAVQFAQAVWFYFQWGFEYTWKLPDAGALVTAMIALTQAGALSLRVVPELPNLPVPLVIAFVTLAIYSLVHRPERPGQFGRLRR